MSSAEVIGKDTKRSWLVLCGVFFSLFMETGVIKSLGVFLPDIREQFATKTWVIGLAMSLTSGFGSVVCLLSAAASKTFNLRRTIIACATLCSIGLVLSSYAGDIRVIVFTFLLTGFGAGSSTVSIGALSAYFDNYYNIAASIVASGTTLSIVVMPYVAQFLRGLYGWRGTLLLLGVLNLHVLCIGFMFKEDHQDFKTKLHERKQTDDDDNEHLCGKWLTLIKHSFDVKLLTSNIAYTAILITNAGSGFYSIGWLLYVIPHAEALHFSPYKASSVAVAGGTAILFGNLVVPLLNKFTSNKVIFYSAICLISVFLSLDAIATIYSSYPGLIVCSVGYGLGKGTRQTAMFTLLNETVSKEQMTHALGWAYAVYGLMAIFAGFVCGWLFDRTGSYAASFLMLGGICAVTVIPLILVDLNKLRCNPNIGHYEKEELHMLNSDVNKKELTLQEFTKNRNITGK